ncbi:MurR/RpiR family transcriptional regulator [Rhodovibrio salinarum]|nr:MurR/RpiR family transcriptional regulator [Rhodovibrio salinarum]
MAQTHQRSSDSSSPGEPASASLESLVRAAYEDLPGSERKLADLILAAPGEIAGYSATELAELAGTSKAAATRFFKRLGFKNFSEARQLARARQDWGSPLYLDRRTAVAPDPSTELTAYLDDELRILQESFSQLDPRDLDAAAASIARARRVWVIGFRNSHFIAGYARWQFIQFRPDVHLLPRTGETLAEQLANVGPQDTVVLVGVRRRVVGFRRVIEACADQGAEILYLTDPTARAESARATWTLVCQVESSYLFDSYATPMSLLRFLAINAYRKIGRAGHEHLEAIERLHDRLHAFD